MIIAGSVLRCKWARPSFLDMSKDEMWCFRTFGLESCVLVQLVQ